MVEFLILLAKNIAPVVERQDRDVQAFLAREFKMWGFLGSKSGIRPDKECRPGAKVEQF